MDYTIKAITLRMPDATYRALKTGAEDLGMSLNSYILLRLNSPKLHFPSEFPHGEPHTSEYSLQ